MGLNFGSSGLFSTDNEERWKGVYDNRIDSIETSSTKSGVVAGLAAGDAATPIHIHIRVKPDEKVVVMFSAVAQQLRVNELVAVRVVRGSWTSDFSYLWTSNSTPLHLVQSAVSLSTIDSPGEGYHTYTLWTLTTTGNASLDSCNLTAFILAVK
jgi:hypothetical protein